MLGSIHSDLQACNIARDQLVANTNIAIGNEFSRQADHLDHSGGSRWIAMCESNGAPTAEVECGVDGLQSSPSNIYPGP